MRSTFLPFSAPLISEEEITAVGNVLRSGWITTGPQCAQFEEAFARYTGAAGAVAVSSATGGMHCVLHALGIGPGDEVITPSMTWVSTANLICLLGATPVFADVDRETLMLSREQIEPLLTSKTKAIIPVHYAGAAVDMDPIRELAKARGIAVIEDAAHAAGTQYKGERIGKKGTCIFSFHPIKNMTTGEGGMICSDDDSLLAQLRSIKFHGLGVDAFEREMQGRAPQAQVLQPGYKYNLTDIQAALGLGQLARLDTFNARRTELAGLYGKMLADIPEAIPLALPAPQDTHAWHLYIIRLDINQAGMDRDAFMAALKEKNIGTGLHFRAVHLQKYYMETFGLKRGLLPDTEWNSDRICSLPLFPGMKDQDVGDVIQAIQSVLAAVKT